MEKSWGKKRWYVGHVLVILMTCFPYVYRGALVLPGTTLSDTLIDGGIYAGMSAILVYCCIFGFTAFQRAIKEENLLEDIRSELGLENDEVKPKVAPDVRESDSDDPDLN